MTRRKACRTAHTQTSPRKTCYVQGQRPPYVSAPSLTFPVFAAATLTNTEEGLSSALSRKQPRKYYYL